jgi:hypothetical protein
LKRLPYPNIERVLRIALGAVLIIWAVFGEPLFGISSPVWIGFLLFNAGFVIITGFYGWCPACALMGRKIKLQQRLQAGK